MSEAGSSSTSTEPVIIQNEACESGEPASKKIKLSPKAKIGKLEHRLEDILCCVVCLDLPHCAIYQCSNGHLMCAGCFTHLLADARIRDEEAKCPTCRVEFSKQCAQRNLAVEKALSELPSRCRFCEKKFSRNTLRFHEETDCEERLKTCKYSIIGCPWRGPHHGCAEHETKCAHPKRTGAEIMDHLVYSDQKLSDERTLYSSLVDLLSFEKILFNDLQLKPYRTDEYVHKLFYETSRFSAFFTQWVVKARINNSQADPSQCSERTMSYQLCLKSNTKPSYPITVHYCIVQGPFGDMKVKLKLNKFEFTENENDSPYTELPLVDSSECNRLLAAKLINFRLIMFLVSR